MKPCGTPAAYWRHIRAGEEPCPADRDAVNLYQACHRQAQKQLAREHPARMRELCAAASGHTAGQDALLALAREYHDRFTEIFTRRKAAAGV